MLCKDELIHLYRDRALRYDLASNLYRLIGLRISTYRQHAVDSLALRSGDTVVELGCGTGLNFPHLYQAVGPTGTIIGVDLTDAMLAQAQKRVRREGWSNVNLVQSDVAAFTYPEPVDGILSTFALTLVPEFDEVIRRSQAALRSSGRMTVFDFKEPEGVPEWLIRFMVRITRPYGVTRDLAERHPWESMERYFSEVEVQDYYFGFLYLAVGKGNEW